MRVRRLPVHRNAHILARAGIDLQGVQMEIEGDLDPDGFMGLDPNVRNGLQEIRFKVHLKCDDEEKARALARLAERTLPGGRLPEKTRFPWFARTSPSARINSRRTRGGFRDGFGEPTAIAAGDTRKPSARVSP